MTSAHLLARHLKLDGEQLAGVRTAAVLRHDLPLQRAGQGTASRDPDDKDLDHRQGNLRVRILEAEGLPNRPDGAACEPYVTVTNAELTRRRVRKTAPGAGSDVRWDEAFDFEGTSACAQIVIDTWDRSSQGGPPDLLGKAVVSLSECRPGIPHTFFSNLLEGKLVVRLLFDFASLPSPEEEEAQMAQILGLSQA